jgi:hypothetical protein
VAVAVTGVGAVVAEDATRCSCLLWVGRESSDLKSTFSVELRLICNNLLGRDLFNCQRESLHALSPCPRDVEE